MPDKDPGKDPENKDSDNWEVKYKAAQESLENLQAKFNSREAQNRIDSKRLKELEEKLSSRDLDDAEKSKDIDKVKGEYEKRLEAEKTARLDTEQRLRNYALKDLFRGVASQHIAENALDDAWMLASSNLDLVQKDGKETLSVKDGVPFATAEDFIKDFVSKRDYLAKNTRVPGTDGNKSPDGNNAAPYTQKQMQEMDGKERFKLFQDPKEGPRLKKIFLMGDNAK